MALKLIVDSIDDLPESVQAEYVAMDDGRFKLDTISVDGLVVENVDGLKSSLSAEREKARKLAVQMKKFQGIEDPAKALEALGKLEEIQNWDGDKVVEERTKAKFDALLAEHKKVVEAKDSSLGNAEAQLRDALITAQAVKAIQVNKGNVDLLLPHVSSKVEMRKDDHGKYYSVVLDDSGNPRIGDAEGNLMSIEGLVNTMKSNKNFAVAFEGTGQSGSGQGGNKGGDNNSGSKVVSAKDQVALNANIADIASGKVKVTN